MKKIIVGITGASGSIYAIKFIESLLMQNIHVHIVASKEGKEVVGYETKLSFENHINNFKNINSGKVELFDNEDLFSSIASGSYKIDGMVIIPCSMNTVSSVAVGLSNTLLLRSAQVMLKEGKQLIIVPRETPYSTIFLENLTSLSKCGVKILPASPAFYNNPQSIDDLVNFVVGRVFDLMGLENNLFTRWGD